MTISCHSRLHISQSAIEENIRRFQSVSSQRFMMIVKSDGYGLGALRLIALGQSLGVDAYGVAFVHEAMELRAGGYSGDLLVIGTLPHEMRAAIQERLICLVCSVNELELYAAESRKLGIPARLHLAIDSGMGRFGVPVDKAVHLAELMAQEKAIQFEGVMSHLSSADDPEEDSYTAWQIQSFETVINSLKERGICPPWIHIANTAGALRFAPSFCTMMRVGLGTFGVSPSLAVKEELNLHDSLRLETRLLEITEHRAGDSLGYGRSYRIESEQMRVGTLGIGYADGILRLHSNRASVEICGRHVPVIANVCMDNTLVDLSQVPEAQAGDTATIFGGSAMSIEALAEESGTIAHEQLTSLGNRVERFFGS